MRPAFVVCALALAVAWWVPPLLGRLTRRGVSPRLGLAAWLTAMANVLALAAVTLQFLVRGAVAGWSLLAEALCRSVAGGACTPTVYRSALVELALGLVTTLATLAVAAAAWRYGRGLRRARRQTRTHGEIARITGRPVAVTAAGAVVLDTPRRAAYCVPGRPATIVLTSGALAVLDAEQVSAVLAHERAHLSGRHHLLVALTRGLATSFRHVPLFARGAAEVARLAEMSADDVAARRSGRRTLVAALLAMGTGTTIIPDTAAMADTVTMPDAALGAASGAVALRVERLLEPPRWRRRAAYAIALTAVMLALVLAAALVSAFAARIGAV
jgi:Zn-dependent protease with chaperone function